MLTARTKGYVIHGVYLEDIRRQLGGAGQYLEQRQEGADAAAAILTCVSKALVPEGLGVARQLKDPGQRRNYPGVP